MKMLPGKKPPDVSALLIALMDWLEQAKKEHSEVDGITDEVAAAAIIEQYALQLFAFGDRNDQMQRYNKYGRVLLNFSCSAAFCINNVTYILLMWHLVVTCFTVHFCFCRNVIKAFYTAGILMDVLSQFGDVSDDIREKKKYAKWKAAYIHNCLKVGDIPNPGPPKQFDDEDDDQLLPKSFIPGYDDAKKDMPTIPPFDFPDENRGADDEPPQPETGTPVAPPPQPQPQPAPVTPTVSHGSVSLTPEQIEKAQKFCKWAASALTYEDVKTAVDNLRKALNLLEREEEA